MAAIAAFKEAFTVDLVRRMIGASGVDGYSEYRKLLEGPVEDAMKAFLKAKSLAGEIAPVDGVEGHDIDVATCWNKIARGEFGESWSAEHNLKRIAQMLGHVLTFNPIYEAEKLVENGADIDDLVDPAHVKIVAQVEAGDLPWWSAGSDSAYCSVDGERYRTEITGWTLKIGKPAGGHSLEPIRPIKRPLYDKVLFDVGSGDLLIADWFRIEGLTEILDKGSGANDISSSDGARDETLRYLEQHGFISVMVGNTSPGVFLDGDNLLIGNTGFDPETDDDVDEPEVDDKGSICTDLWWATIMPREKLIALAGLAVGPDKAVEAVEKAIADHHGSCINVKVEPGVRHVYFSGDGERFAENFYSPDLSVTPSFQPSIVLSTRELTIEDKPQPAPARGI